MEMEKKNLAIIILAIVLAASGVGNIILGVMVGFIKVTPPEYITFTRAVPSGPSILDPTDSWEQAANEVIRQVAEPLWYYNWTDMNMGRINVLATAETWENFTAVRVTLRQNVKFHDGTLFNAEAAKWNLDRLLRMEGCVPGSEENRKGSPHSLYEDPLGDPLINRTEVTGPYEIIIHLNTPFSTLVDLLCYTSGVMLSPSAHAGDANSFIPLDGGDLVGTGPYKYDTYIAEQEVRFSRWDDYWGGPIPHEGNVVHFEKMVFVVIDDPNSRNYAMLAHDVDWVRGLVTDLFPIYRADPTIDFVELENAGLGIDYLGFNNKEINVTWRKAMSYCFNYTYMVQEYWQDRVFRSYGWVSPGYGEWYTDKQEELAPYLNVTYAREIIIADIPEAAGRSATNDDHWGLGSNTLVSFNYSYNTDNQWRSDLYVLLSNYFSNISIFVIDGGTDWAYFLYRAYGYVPGGYDELQLYWVGWGPDYLDPINMIQPLLSNVSQSNSAQVNDPWIENAFIEYFKQTDHAIKVQMIHNISIYCISELYSHMFGFHQKGTTVHSADIYWDVDDEVAAYSFIRYDFYAYPLARNESFFQ